MWYLLSYLVTWCLGFTVGITLAYLAYKNEIKKWLDYTGNLKKKNEHWKIMCKSMDDILNGRFKPIEEVIKDVQNTTE
jgi:hypothetical protein